MRFNAKAKLLMACLVLSEAAQGDTFKISGVLGSADSAAAKEVVAEAYRRIGHDIKIQWHPGAKALELANSGETDGELQRVDGIAKKFPNLIQIEIPINFLQGGVFATRKSFKVDGWHSLKPYRIGIVKGIIFAREGTLGMKVTEADNYPQLFDFLRDDVVDIAVMPRINGQLAIKEKRVAGLKEMDGVLETLFLYHYVHSKHKDLVPKLDAALKQMLVEGRTREMRDRAYGGLLK